MSTLLVNENLQFNDSTIKMASTHGNSLQIGTNSQYTTNTICLSYDGNSYSTVTGDEFIQFANTNANTSLYFGDLNSYNWYGLQYVLSQQITLGEGSIIWEYHNDG